MEGGDQNMLSTRVVHFRSQHRGVTEMDAGRHTPDRNGAVGTKQDRIAGKGQAAGPGRGWESWLRGC